MRKEGGTKGKQGNGVDNPAIGKGEAGQSLPIYYHLAFERLCKLTPTADSNGLLLFTQRRKLVSEQQSSRSERAIPSLGHAAGGAVG
jgi:hypothetical protein